MKLRTTATSIRLRLSQSDVRNFAEHGVVEETLALDLNAEQPFTYRLERNPKTKTLLAGFANNRLTVSIPAGQADEWSSTDMVGVDNSNSDAAIKILVEKDFTCLVPRAGEDDRDTYPHPKAGQNC